MNAFNYDIVKSQIEHYLALFDELAMKHDPPEAPLIATNPYYESAKMLEEKLFHIYYAYYGYGKTYGVGLKFYHEARAGELEHSYNVVLINLREMLEHCKMFKDIVNKVPSGNSMIEALLLASLYAAINSDDFVSKSTCLSLYSTIKLDQVSKRTLSQMILSRVEDRDKVIDKIENIVEKISEKTQRRIVIIFDEFESTINYLVPNTRLSEFLYEMGVLMRRFLDRGLKRLRVVLLLQKAIFNEEERKNFMERLSKGYGSGPSAILGILVNREIKSYPPNVYTNYIIEALQRLSNKLGEPKIISNTIESIHREKFKVILEHLLRSLSIIPPRVAFPLIRKIVANIALQGLTKRIRNRSELEDIITHVLSEYVNVNKILLYYFDSDKIHRISNDILSRASYIILNEIGGDNKEDIFEVGGTTYPGAVLLERHYYDKKRKYLEVRADMLIVRFKKLWANSTIRSMKDNIQNRYMKQIIQHIRSLMDNYLDARELSINITSVILKIPRIMLTPLKQAVEAAIEDSLEALRETSQVKINNSWSVTLHNLEEDMPIILYYIGSGEEPSDETLNNYLKYRSKDLINEIKAYFI